MDTYKAEDLQEVLRPITSLIQKSEKAQLKLTPGTWQYSMLEDNIKALHTAFSLMNNETHDIEKFTQKNLEDTLRTLTSMISKVEKTQTKFAKGTSQHTLQKNRLKSLQIASTFIEKAMK